MSAVDLAVARLKSEEGFRSMPYRDSVGKLTIGYGNNLDAGWSADLALAVLQFQTQYVNQQIASFWWSVGVDDVRMSVVIDLAFNLGVAGLNHFPKMLAAIGAKNWQAAHDELLDSEAASALPGRYQALAQILLTGAT